VTYPLEANQTLENANPKDGTQTHLATAGKDTLPQSSLLKRATPRL